MRVAEWNAEGLSEAKQNAAVSAAVDLHIDAIILVETWVRYTGSMQQPQRDTWSRMDLVHQKNDPRAKRGEGGISLLYDQRLNASVYRRDPESRWCIWLTNNVTIAVFYAEPSVTLEQYQDTLDRFSTAIHEGRAFRPGPIVVLGDFNARLGNITGDSLTNPRRSATTDFVCASSLTLLSGQLNHANSRWTWKSPLGRSVVDLAMISDCTCNFLEIASSPIPTPHQLVIVNLATDVAEIMHDSDRWNWSRKAFSRNTRRKYARRC